METLRRTLQQTGMARNYYSVRRPSQFPGEQPATSIRPQLGPTLRAIQPNERCGQVYTGKEPLPQGYPKKWLKCPGDPGFNEYIQGLLRDANLTPHLACPDPSTRTNRQGDMWHQRTLARGPRSRGGQAAAWLVHPASPISRLLVVWQLGTGKTLGMIRVLDNFDRSCPTQPGQSRRLRGPAPEDSGVSHPGHRGQFYPVICITVGM